MAASKAFDLILNLKDKMSGKMRAASANLNRFSDKIARANSEFKKMNSLGKTVGNTFVKMGDKLTKAGKKLTTFVSTPIVGAGVFSLKQFADFENAMLSVKTLLDDTSFGSVSLGDGFKQMGKDLERVSTTIPVEIDSLTKSLFDTVSAGVDASKAVEFVGASSKLAVAGVTEVSTATDGMTSAMNAFALNAADSEKIASKFFVAQKRGKTTISELSSYFGQSASVAASFGLSLNDLLASVSAATTGGIKTSQAFTGVNAVLTNIAKPTKDAKAEAKRLGIQFDSTALRTKGFKKFIDDLTKSNKFSQKSIEKLFGSVEAQKIMFALTGNSAKAFDNVLKELKSDAGTLTTFTQAYNEQAKSQSNQFTLMKNKLGALSRKFGEMIANSKSFQKAMKLIDDTISKIEASPELQETIAQFAMIAVVVGPALVVLGTLMSSFGNLILMSSFLSAGVGGIGSAFLAVLIPLAKFLLIAGLIAGAAYLIYKNWEPIKEFFTTIWNSPFVKFVTFRKLAEDLGIDGKKIKSAWEATKRFFSDLWDNPINDTNLLVIALKGVVSVMKDIWDYAVKAVSALGDFAKWSLGFGGSGGGEIPKPKSPQVFGWGKNTQAVAPTPMLAPDRKFAQTNIQRTVETKDAHVTVDFKNLPRGTSVMPTKNESALDLNLGYASA